MGVRPHPAVPRLRAARPPLRDHAGRPGRPYGRRRRVPRRAGGPLDCRRLLRAVAPADRRLPRRRLVVPTDPAPDPSAPTTPSAAATATPSATTSPPCRAPRPWTRASASAPPSTPPACSAPLATRNTSTT